MKKLFSVIAALVCFTSFSASLEGTVTYKEKTFKGVLFIFAKKHDGSMPMPLAVKRIANPTFPLKFSLSEKDAMMESIPFEGPFKVTARLSPTGNAMDKSGPQAVTEKPIKSGEKSITLNIK